MNNIELLENAYEIAGSLKATNDKHYGDGQIDKVCKIVELQLDKIIMQEKIIDAMTEEEYRTVLERLYTPFYIKSQNMTLSDDEIMEIAKKSGQGNPFHIPPEFIKQFARAILRLSLIHI